MKIGSFIISKPVWIRLGLIALLFGLPIMLGLQVFFIPISFPAILLVSRTIRQFRIDNGYDEPAEIDQ